MGKSWQLARSWAVLARVVERAREKAGKETSNQQSTSVVNECLELLRTVAREGMGRLSTIEPKKTSL